VQHTNRPGKTRWKLNHDEDDVVGIQHVKGASGGDERDDNRYGINDM
jgi:hypothetical protein